jgi:hypothetical protein
MPVVPQYRQGQVQERDLPNVRVSTEAPSAAFGGGIQNVNQAFSNTAVKAANIYREYQDRADESEATAAKVKYQKDIQMFQLGNPDPTANEKGYMSYRGENAKGIYEDYKKKENDAYISTFNGLSNDRQRELFYKNTLELRNSYDVGIRKHQMMEADELEQKRYKANMDIETNHASIKAGDPDEVYASIRRKMQSIDTYGKARGWTPEEVEMEKRNQAGISHAMVIDSLISKSPTMAKSWLDAHSELLTPESRGKISKRVDEVLVESLADKNAAEIIKKNPKLDDSAAAFDSLSKIKDPTIQEKTRKSVMDYYKNLQTTQKIAGSAALVNAIKRTQNADGSFYPKNPGEYAEVAALPPKERAKYNGMSSSSLKTAGNFENPVYLSSEEIGSVGKPYYSMTQEELSFLWKSNDPRDQLAREELKHAMGFKKYQSEMKTYTKTDAEITSISNLRSVFVDSVIRNTPSLTENKSPDVVKNIREMLKYEADKTIEAVKVENGGKVNSEMVAKKTAEQLMNPEYKAFLESETSKYKPAQKPIQSVPFSVTKEQINVKKQGFYDSYYNLTNGKTKEDKDAAVDAAKRASSYVSNYLQRKFNLNPAPKEEQLKEFEQVSTAMNYPVRVTRTSDGWLWEYEDIPEEEKRSIINEFISVEEKLSGKKYSVMENTKRSAQISADRKNDIIEIYLGKLKGLLK